MSVSYTHLDVYKRQVQTSRPVTYLFLHLKRHIGGQRYDDDDDVKTAVQQWLSSQAADFYEDGIQKLITRYDKCLNIGGNYVEK